MTSLMTRSVLLFLGLMLIAKGSYAETSLNIQNLLAVLNGPFSNSKQVKENAEQHNLVAVRLAPVLIPKLHNESMIFLEQSVNGSITLMLVGNLSESANGKIYYIDLFNFTDFSGLQPMTYNFDDLKEIPREQFTSYGPCRIALFRKASGEYMGEWENCRQVINGKHPRYTVSVECDVIILSTAVESVSLIPYELLSNGPKFPMIDAPSNFFNPCQDSE